jgi:hypothetical protein
MTNFPYAGAAGSQGISRSEHPFAASPVILVVYDNEDTPLLLHYLFDRQPYRVSELEEAKDTLPSLRFSG